MPCGYGADAAATAAAIKDAGETGCRISAVHLRPERTKPRLAIGPAPAPNADAAERDRDAGDGCPRRGRPGPRVRLRQEDKRH